MSNAGLNVRTIRQQVGMSLRALAAAAVIDPATLSKIENGKQQLTEDLARKLSLVLHVSTGMLFAEPGAVEFAMLRMRKAPVLTEEQLFHWREPDTFEEAEDQVYLHTDSDRASRHIFALEIKDQANEPVMKPGDIALFDALRVPKLGEIAVAQRSDGTTYIGQFRPMDAAQKKTSSPEAFSLVPINRLYPEVSSKLSALVLRGVRFEKREYF